MDAGAVISECQQYRYHLWRTWGSGPRMTFIGLNPSTADATHDDPTIRKIVKFARREGCGGLDMINLFAWRDTDPKAMLKVERPRGPENNEFIRMFTGPGRLIVAGWGVDGSHLGRGARVLAMIDQPVKILGLTKGGEPRHPLYMRDDTPFVDLGGQGG